MKLLLDQNISYRLVKLISDKFPVVEQVRNLGLENKSDKEIWEFAKESDWTIVTFDSDFYDFSVVWGHPPKVIWLRSGNRTTAEIKNILIKHREIIAEFIAEENLSCLELINKSVV